MPFGLGPAPPAPLSSLISQAQSEPASFLPRLSELRGVFFYLLGLQKKQATLSCHVWEPRELVIPVTAFLVTQPCFGMEREMCIHKCKAESQNAEQKPLSWAMQES